MKHINSFFQLAFLSFCLMTFCACGSEPNVSRYMTVEDFNSAQQLAGDMLDDMGYASPKYEASTYYKYVLFDGDKRCEEGGEFCTCSDEIDHISTNDRCIKCGRTWANHEDY